MDRHPERDRDGEPGPLPRRPPPQGRTLLGRGMARSGRAGDGDPEPQLLVSRVHDHHGIAGETPEDAWMTVDLIDRMEQIPDGHFVTAPLTFVPIGVLRGEQFYNLDEMIDEARFNVAYRAWRHILREVDQDLWRLTALPAPMKALIVVTARLGGRYVLGIMERFAREKGFRIRAPAKTRRQAEGHTISFPAA